MNYKITEIKDISSRPISMKKEDISAIQECKTVALPECVPNSVERLDSGLKKYNNPVNSSIKFASLVGILQFCKIILEVKWAIKHATLTLLDITYKNVKQAKIHGLQSRLPCLS